ncbi:MAG TPA: HAD hydrolase family protein [Verrucomicrobiae bacterium]|jgi:3-deoxy-D-manno-octulosonate 8-phosphate phosphatase (KDO 8-P phosphatase)|nr:HAD hydrolase family protein [Verrucomicrobiae bacterium]
MVYTNDELNARLAKVKLFLCDVDGILTDASVFIGLDQEIKRFHIRDGLGLVMLRHAGIKIGWVSKRPSLATTRRAEELKIDFLEQSKGSKVEIIENLLLKTKLTWEQVSYMGDDIVDLGVLRRAGFAATVADATDEAKAVSHYVTRADGGRGGVREVIDMLLKAQGLWDKLVAGESA